MREDLQETKNGAPRLMELRLSRRSSQDPLPQFPEKGLWPSPSAFGRQPHPQAQQLGIRRTPTWVLSSPTAGVPLRALREPPRP